MSLLRVVSVVALVLAVCTVVGAHASAQSSAPPDVVRLHDGTFLRGTIVERSPSQVIVLLPTGETRTYAAELVEFAGPDVPAGPAIVQVPAAAPRERMATLHVRSRQRELSLQQLQGSASVTVWTGRGSGTARIDQFGVVCNAPCDVEVPEGTYQLGVAQGTGDAARAGRPIELRGDVTLDLAYNDRSGQRVAGWLTFGLGAAAGAALLVAGIFTGPTYSSSFGYSRRDLNVPMMIAGGVVFGVGMIVGMIFAFMQDAPSIEVAADGVRF
ncbi:MAG: hypothetical protein M3Y87_15880 [Myxococcota bacterium]|nr:hypothetical protein [Myxococcota bacterium]